MLVFASHVYAAGWRLAPWGVPVAVAIVWAAVISSAMALAARLGLRSPAARGLGAALVGITLDLLMEPVAVRAGLWRWTPPGPWLGVPIGNFVGWGVIIASYAIGAERWAAGNGVLGPTARRLALAALSIVALVLVGLVWTRLDAERLFAGAGGWAAWASILAATMALGARRVAPLASSDSLAGRLASARGRLPAAVFGLVAAVFAADAACLGGSSLLTVAVASTAVVAFISQQSTRRGSEAMIDWWRRSVAARLAPAPGLLAVLMKPRNGEPWSAEDRMFLKRELRAAARWTPALFFLLIPGSLLLLPVYAWLLDRRHRSRDAKT